MKRLSSQIGKAILDAGTDPAASRKAFRASQVAELWKKAICEVYGDNAALVLSHTNAVSIVKEGSVRTLIVYLDDGLIRNDIKVRQEDVKRVLMKNGELIDVFKTLPSKFDMKNRHPFEEKKEIPDHLVIEKRTLSEEENQKAEEIARDVEDPKMRDALIRAIKADLSIHG